MFVNNRRSRFLKVFSVVFVIGVAVGALIYYMSLFKDPDKPENNNQFSNVKQQVQVPGVTIAPQSTTLPQNTPVPQETLPGGNSITGVPVAQTVAKLATDSVVGIMVERVATGKLFNNNEESQVGMGSGVIVTENGYILTNHHVAGGKSKRIVVSFADGRNVDGETIWSDPVLDLAVVRVNLTGLPALKLGDAEKLEVGEPAVAIGNPLGLEFQRTVTSGIISALNRTISIETEQGTNYMEDLIQTDASINPGNSGGPLLNSRGEVVGINTIKVSSAEAIGFAVPINVARPIIERLVDKGEFTEAYMGLFAYDKSLIPYIDGNTDIEHGGVYVAHIDEKGPAYKAGLRVGCIIRQIDGQEISSMLQLRTIIFSKAPGDVINVTHLMHGTDKWVTDPITLTAKEKDGMITR